MQPKQSQALGASGRHSFQSLARAGNLFVCLWVGGEGGGVCVGGSVGGWVGKKFVAVQCDLNNCKRWEQVNGTVFSRWQEQVILCVYKWVGGCGCGCKFCSDEERPK